jgi:hypothetical protein
VSTMVGEHLRYRSALGHVNRASLGTMSHRGQTLSPAPSAEQAYTVKVAGPVHDVPIRGENPEVTAAPYFQRRRSFLTVRWTRNNATSMATAIAPGMATATTNNTMVWPTGGVGD